MQTNHKLITEILDRIGTGVPSALLIHNENVNNWSQSAFKAIQTMGIIKPASPAKIIDCPGCEDACLMPVEVMPGDGTRPARIFIACDKREDTGCILIDPADLERWQIDVERFASLLASALDTGHVPVEIIPHQAFYLGTLAVNRKRRTAVFVGNNESLKSLLEADIVQKYPHPFFLVADAQTGQQGGNHEANLSLRQFLIFSDTNSISFDREMLEDFISKEDERKVSVSNLSSIVTEENIFRKEGQMWALQYGGWETYLKHSKGLLYISYLLGSPSQEYHVAEIVKAAENPQQDFLAFSSGDISTKETIGNYRKRLTDIRTELADAKRTGDPLLAQELLQDKEALEKQIVQAVGMGGKLKKNPDETRRQAKAVSSAIARSLKVIGKNHPPLWQHLFNAINRGEYLSYTPEIDITWITTQ